MGFSLMLGCLMSENQLILENLKILLVEDNWVHAESISQILELEGAEVTVVESVQSAIAILGEQPIDLVICDIRLPDEFGYALGEYLKTLALEQDRLIPAIAITGLATKLNRQHCLDVGFQEYLPKPSNSKELILAIQNLVLSAR
jgi:CheY-like chemotaxis protein